MRRPPVLLLAALLPLAAMPCRAEPYTQPVYAGDSIEIEAGLDGAGGRALAFGDELVLSVVVRHDPGNVGVTALDDAFFTSHWPQAEGVYLRASAFETRRVPGPRSSEQRAVFRFQVLGCPDTSAPTCPGDRYYPVPAFGVGYTERATGEPGVARFELPAAALTVMTTIPRDADNQLFPFEVYFPYGGYPDPQTGTAGTGAALLTAGFAFAILTGGIFMWPFRSRSDDTTQDAVPRWKKQLEKLRAADAVDETRYLDELRRCLVWYCNDELGVDAFVWLDLAERNDDVREAAEDDASYTGLRDLFIELLHAPTGQADALRERLERLIVRGGHA